MNSLKGVSFHRASGRYRAKLKFGGKWHHIGTFSTAEEAARAYDAAAVRIIGPNGRQPFKTIPLTIRGAVAVVPLSGGERAVVDVADWPLVSGFRWSVAGPRQRYAVRKVRRNCRSITVRMHRLLVGAPDDRLVDHRDGNGLNNRRSNLRVCTDGQNCANVGVVRSRTGWKGVTWRKLSRCYIAQFAGAEVGRFNDPIEAARAYDRAAYAKYGRFACVNFPEEFADARGVNREGKS